MPKLNPVRGFWFRKFVSLNPRIVAEALCARDILASRLGGTAGRAIMRGVTAASDITEAD
jgi:hypothetical protein